MPWPECKLCRRLSSSRPQWNAARWIPFFTLALTAFCTRLTVEQIRVVFKTYHVEADVNSRCNATMVQGWMEHWIIVIHFVCVLEKMFLLTCEQASFLKRIREEGPPDRTWKVEKGQTPRLNGLVDLCPTNGSKSWQILFPINTNELYSKIKTDGKSFLPPLFVCRIANFQKCKWWKFAFN